MSAVFSNFVPIIKVPIMAYKKGEDRRQRTLFPDCIDDYVEQDSPVRLMDAFVDRLDMEKLGFQRFVPADTGAPGYDPRDLLKLYTYGYYYEVRSSRKLARQCLINIEVMWLLSKLAPDFRTISDFRKDNKEAIEKTFKEFNRFCYSQDLFSKSYVSIDGSKFKAVNAKDLTSTSRIIWTSLTHMMQKRAANCRKRTWSISWRTARSARSFTKATASNSNRVARSRCRLLTQTPVL